MKAFILTTLMAIAFSSAQATPPIVPYTLNLVNTGGETIYYALAINTGDYTSTLSIPINGITDKNDVSTYIKPGATETLIFYPLSNYYKFNDNLKITYKFYFGHAMASAQSALNHPQAEVSFNITGTYLWATNVRAGTSYSLTCTATSSEIAECDIGSSSGEYVY